MKRNIFRQLLVGVFVLTLAACGGGGGSSTPLADPGPPPPGGATPVTPVVPDTPQPDYATAEGLIATITNVTVGPPMKVDFMVTDSFGIAIQDLTSSNVRFTVAKLIPAANGSSSAWQSYINRVKTPNVNPANAPAVQATSESGGTLDNYGDGTYTYTMKTDITNVTSPLAVSYDSGFTHRVAIQFSGGPTSNPAYDWVPATGATTGIETRDIVSVDSCNSCHDPLALHGGGRVDPKLCVTCHNPGTTEPNSLNTVDFKVMIHKIHRGKNLPSVVAGGVYEIYGYRDSRHDYSHLAYPQDIRNCTKCHAGTGTGTAGDILTTDGDN
ncbi:MAG: OmcA/MtrC family decaheme c-type cytochrome, partial [Gammaproteobacteria bacterium]|nr:OmcA/MtrC family decaheme c-type cytochrome [Gammaproteobacteria bacterium]